MIEKVRIGNEEYTFLTVGGLGKYLSRKTKNGGRQARTRYSILQLTRDGKMPEANFRDKNGGRLYSKAILAPKLKEIFEEISSGRKITDEQKVKLATAFQEEREYFRKIMEKGK